MRFRVPEVFLGAFLTVAVFALGMLFASSSLQPQRAEQHAATDQHADNKSHDGHQAKSLLIPEDSTGFFTLWIAAFTGILAISTIFLWRSTRDAAIAGRIAAEHIPRVERAYLFVGPFEPFEAWNDDATRRITSCGLAFENQGKTPAMLKQIYGQFSAMVPTEDVPRYDLEGGKFRILDIAIPANGAPIQERDLFRSELTGPQYFSGYVEYDDIFRERVRISRFCVKIFPEEPHKIELAGPRSWNDWD